MTTLTPAGQLKGSNESYGRTQGGANYVRLEHAFGSMRNALGGKFICTVSFSVV